MQLMLWLSKGSAYDMEWNPIEMSFMISTNEFEITITEEFPYQNHWLWCTYPRVHIFRLKLKSVWQHPFIWTNGQLCLHGYEPFHDWHSIRLYCFQNNAKTSANIRPMQTKRSHMSLEIAITMVMMLYAIIFPNEKLDQNNTEGQQNYFWHRLSDTLW